MLFLAIKMLVGDKTKYIGLVLGISFASFIITQQAAILIGIVDRTFGFVTDTSQPNIWVVDPTVQFIDDIKPMKDTDLYRVRGVSGLEWAVPLYKGTIQARLRNGGFQTCILIGLDDASYIGGPPEMLEGSLTDLRIPDAVIVNDVGAKTKLASRGENGELIPLMPRDRMELNDNRAFVVGICRVSRTFQSQPVLYTTYGRATSFVPSQRKLLSFILAKSLPGVDPAELCHKITSQTGLAAYTPAQLKRLTLNYYIQNTGIFINFGVAIFLGFIIGTAIAGQTLYNFAVENLPYFGIYKAMGSVNSMLMKMVLLQALFASAVGWGIGMGAASLFGYLTRHTEISFKLPIGLYLLSAGSILLISLLAAFISIRKVVRVDPAIVFKN